MKRLAIILLTLMLAAVSCTKEEFYITEGSLVYTHEYTVHQNQWSRPAGCNYFISEWNNADITPVVEESGAVIAYAYNNGNWHALPYVFPYQNTVTNDTVCENIRFDWTVGKISFIMEDQNGKVPDTTGIGDMYFKVCAII